MKKAKRLLATAMSALMLTTGMAGFGSIGATAATTGDTDDPDYIIGRFQREDEIAKTRFVRRRTSQNLAGCA